MSAQFYFPLTFCYDLICTQIDVPWVPDFQTVYSKVCVLTKEVGSQLPGMYVKGNGWVMALSYEDMCSFLAGAVDVKVIVNAVTTQSVPPSAIVFRSGYLMPANSSIEPGNAVWVVVTPVSVSNSSSTEEEVPYSKRVDFISDTELYKGEAAPGSSESSSVWRIHKIGIGLDDDVTETWAGGDALFNKTWSFRDQYTYS